MNRAPIIPYEERVKRRREYLRKIAAANTLETIGSGVTMSFGYLALFITAVFWLNFLMFEPTLEPGRLAFFFRFLLVTGLPALLGGLLWHASASSTRSIPFVPPVGEQIAALPADEVLLRGSD